MRELIPASEILEYLNELSDLARAVEADAGTVASAEEAIDAIGAKVRELMLDEPRKGPPAPLFAGPN